MEERPKYKMRFVGFDANGELIGSAPAFKPGEIRMLPIEYAQNDWWELIEEVPDLVLPEETKADSVFIEGVFVPPEDDVIDVMPQLVTEDTDSEAISSTSPKNDIEAEEPVEGSETVTPVTWPETQAVVEPEPEGLYHCPLCGHNHKTTSKIGKEHLKHRVQKSEPDEEEVVDLPPTEEVISSTQFEGGTITVKLKSGEEEPADPEDLKAFYRKKTVKELRNIIKGLGGEVNYIHRPFELVNEILRLKAEKEG